MTENASRKRKPIRIAAWTLATFFILLLIVITAVWFMVDRAGKSSWTLVQAELEADGEPINLAELHLHASAHPDAPDVSNYGSIAILQDISEPYGNENRKRLESLFFAEPNRLPIYLATSPPLPASDLDKWADSLWKVIEMQRARPRPRRSIKQDLPSTELNAGNASQRISSYLDLWEPVLTELRQGIDRDVAHFEPAFSERKDFPEVRRMPHLTGISHAALALHLHALVAARNGDRDGLILNLQTLARLAEACANEHQLFAHHGASRIMLMLETGIVAGFRAKLWQDDPVSLRKCMTMLQHVNLHAKLEPALRDYILETTGLIDSCSTLEGRDDAFPPGTPVPNFHWQPPGWYQNQQAIYTSYANDHLFKALRDGACFGDQITAAKLFDSTLTGSLSRSHRLIILFTPMDGMHYIHYVPACAEAYRRMAIIACAIRLYRLTHDGRTPETLNALVPEFLKEVPNDPMDDAPMRYLRLDENSYQLWSIALDRVDDKGRLNLTPNRGGPSGKYADLSFYKYTGDWPWPSDITAEK